MVAAATEKKTQSINKQVRDDANSVGILKMLWLKSLCIVYCVDDCLKYPVTELVLQ